MATATIIPTIFNYSNHQVRTITHEDNSLWFVAKDVFEALSIPWTGKMALSKIPTTWWVVRKLLTTQKNQSGETGKTEKGLIVINEPAVYKLAFRSNKPEADKFTNWVASEVLPSIRKNGAYAMDLSVGRISSNAVQPEPEQLTQEERNAIMDDIYNNIGQIRDSADNLVSFYREMHKSLNKIGNMISILNAVDYKERRIRELKAGR